MKKILLYYNFSYPIGGGDYLPLLFAAELMKHNDVTLAVDMKSGFERSAVFFGMDSVLAGLKVEQLMPEGYSLSGHHFLCSLRRSRRIKIMARHADICISACNIIDFGKPGHHFINILDFGDTLFSNYILHKKSNVQELCRCAVEQILRLFSGIRSKRSIIRNPREHIYPNSIYAGSLIKEYYHSFNGSLFYPPTTFEPTLEEQLDRAPLKVVYIGRLNPGKRITDIIDIVERARAISGKDLTLHLAGHFDNAYVDVLKKISEEKDWIRLVGPVFGREKERFLLSSSYAVHARRNEEFGIAVTEYMKAGCIPIVPDEGGSMEIVDNPALTYHTNEHAAKILVHLLNDEAFRQAQLNHCQERAKVFSFEHYMKNQHKILDKILNDSL